MPVVSLGWENIANITGEPKHQLFVDATKFAPIRNDEILIHAQGNLRSIDEPLGWWFTIDMEVEEDQLMLRVEAGSDKVFLRDLLDSWSVAKFRFVKSDLINGGNWCQVTHRELPVEEILNNTSDMKRKLYKLKSEVIHVFDK